MLCSKCTRTKCKDEGTAHEPIELECTECDGEGCKQCNWTGAYNVIGCPNKYCKEVIPAVRLADLFGKGVMPIAGGVLDQSCTFLQAVETLESEEHTMRSERNK